LIGIKGVINLIAIRPPVSAGSIKGDIERALVRNAETDARNITVETSDGTVTLKGTVHSWAERDEADWSAWSAQGVHKVQNELTVVAQ
jgi:osmotically-inducible protein OsmY